MKNCWDIVAESVRETCSRDPTNYYWDILTVGKLDFIIRVSTKKENTERLCAPGDLEYGKRDNYTGTCMVCESLACPRISSKLGSDTKKKRGKTERFFSRYPLKDFWQSSSCSCRCGRSCEKTLEGVREHYSLQHRPIRNRWENIHRQNLSGKPV